MLAGGWLLLSLATVPRLAAQGSDTTATLSLDDLLNTPVSTAARYAQGVREVAGSVTIVTAEDIQRFGYRSLEDVLQSMAGVYASYDRNYAGIGLRGFSRPTDYNNRILLLIDGHSTNESMWGSAMLGQELVLNLRAVERIEMVRGPASALYGTGAMFGVINIITRSGSALQGGRVEIDAGSYGLQSASAVWGVARGRRGEVAVSVMAENRDGRDVFSREFDAPASNNGIAHNLDYQRRAGGLLSARLGDLTLRGQYTYRDKGIPTASFGVLFDDPRSKVRDAAGYLELKYEHDLSAAYHLMTRTYFDNYYYHGTYPFAGDLNTDRASNRVLGAEAAMRWDPVSNNRVTAGAEYRWNARTTYTSWDDGVRNTNLDQPFSIVSLYLQDDFQILNALSLLTGVRHDESSIAGGATTPRVAMIYNPAPGTTFKAMYGRAFRAPSLYESAYPAAGQELGPERMTMLELIWMQRLGSDALLTSSLYRYDVDGLIDVVNDTTGSLTYANRGQVRAQGLETTLDVRMTTRFRGYLNYSVGRVVDDGTGTPLTNSPIHLLKAGFAGEVTGRARAALELRYESGRRTLTAARTDPFLIANLNLEIHPFRNMVANTGFHGLDGFDLALRIANLFDTRYDYPAGTEHLQSSFEQDRRAVVLRVGYEF